MATITEIELMADVTSETINERSELVLEDLCFCLMGSAYTTSFCRK